MKKKLGLLSGVLLISMCLLLPSVRSFAISTLSIFRVKDTKTITITLADIEEMMNHPFFRKEVNQAEFKQDAYDKYSGVGEQFAARIHELDNINEFRDFNVNLPRERKDEQPLIRYMESKTIDFVVNSEVINGYLEEMGLPSVIQPEYDGKEVNIHFPSAVMAQYEDVTLLATQGIHVEDDNDVMEGLWSNVLELPFLTEGIRSQLSMVDWKGRDVYLPVIMGLGRETSIGNQKGYVYSTKDLMQIYSSFSKDLDEKERDASIWDGSALIWTKDGVLYCLFGEKSDGELSKIARSVR